MKTVQTPVRSDPPLSWRRWPELSYVFAAGMVLALVWGLAQLFAAHIHIFLLTFFAVLFAAILNYPVSFLSRWMPRGIASMITLVTVIGLMVLLVYLTIPIISEQGRQLIEQAPSAVDSVRRWWFVHVERGPIAEVQNGEELMASVKDKLMKSIGALASSMLQGAYGLLSVFSGLLLLLVLGTFLSYEPSTYVNGIVRFVPKRNVAAVCGFLGRCGETISRWMVGTLVAMAVIGVTTGAGLYFLGVKSWFVLGILSFFGEFVPYAGPLVTSIPAIIVAFTDSPQQALYVMLLYGAIQTLESYLLQPLLMRRAVDLNPGVLIVWQLLMTGAFGVLGLIVSTPMLACIKVASDEFYVKRTLGKAEDEPSECPICQDDPAHKEECGEGSEGEKGKAAASPEDTAEERRHSERRQAERRAPERRRTETGQDDQEMDRH